MFLRKTLTITFTAFLLINCIGHTSSQTDNDNNVLERHSDAVASISAFTWDNAGKELTDRIFGLESPSADDLERIFCAIHITGVNPADRNYVLTAGIFAQPLWSGEPFCSADKYFLSPVCLLHFRRYC
jgi:hypothetical protein